MSRDDCPSTPVQDEISSPGPEAMSATSTRTNEELQVFNVESWLTHHGKKLNERFQLSAYKLANQIVPVYCFVLMPSSGCTLH